MKPQVQTFSNSYTKTFAQVNGKVVQDNEVQNTIANDKQIIQGHYNDTPFLIKRRLMTTPFPMKRKSRKSNKKSKKSRKTRSKK
jgi:hypothetical protein